MILFFDTETTGFADFNLRASDPSQPHIVQLAAVLTADDGKELESHNVIVKPDGWTIPKEASDIHGITDEIAAACGIDEKLATNLFMDMVKKASVLVAHNVTFDKFIARIAARRHGLLTDDQDAWWKALPCQCTMRQMTDLCQLPGKFAGKFKWPNLQEAHQHAFGTPFEGAHSAMADVQACKALYFWLKNRDVAKGEAK